MQRKILEKSYAVDLYLAVTSFYVYSASFYDKNKIIIFYDKIQYITKHLGGNMKGHKFIFFFTGRIPLIQIFTILLFGSFAYLLAGQIDIGNYVGFEVFPERNGVVYVVEIPKEYSQEIPENSPGKWSFNKQVGKWRALTYIDGFYVLDTQGLEDGELDNLGSDIDRVYVEFQVNRKKLLSWREK